MLKPMSFQRIHRHACASQSHTGVHTQHSMVHARTGLAPSIAAPSTHQVSHEQQHSTPHTRAAPPPSRTHSTQKPHTQAALTASVAAPSSSVCTCPSEPLLCCSTSLVYAPGAFSAHGTKAGARSPGERTGWIVRCRRWGARACVMDERACRCNDDTVMIYITYICDSPWGG